MKLYEVTYIPDGITAVVENRIAIKTILKADNEIEAIKSVAIKISPMSAEFIKKIEGDAVYVREILMRVNGLCLMVSELTTNQTTIVVAKKIDASFILKTLVFEMGETISYDKESPNCLLVSRFDGNGNSYTTPIVYGTNTTQAKIDFETLTNKNK